MSRWTKILFILIILLAFFLRFYQLNEIPAGLHADGASQAYNAYSILKTGKDMYGKSFPVLFRANGSYQPPVYTYLTIIPVYLFGNTPFSARFISALSGTLLVAFTFLLFTRFGKNNNKDVQALFAAAIIAISPWAIHFSRLAVEANLSVSLFVLTIIILIASLKKKYLFLLASLLIGLITHTYYSERITAILFLAGFVFINRKTYLGRKKEVFLGILLLLATLIPHVQIAKTGALTKRLSQVSYLNENTFANGPAAAAVTVSGEFLEQYLLYYSPKSLFFVSGTNLGRTTPDLSVFYPWFVIPFLFGLGYLYRRMDKMINKITALLFIVGPIPAGFTGDSFYPLRVLVFLWSVSLITSYGCLEIWNIFRRNLLRSVLFAGITFYSVFIFYVSYFVLFKYEESNNFGYPYIKLVSILDGYKNKNILIDNNSRAWGVGIRTAYLMKFDPVAMQQNLSSQLTTPYYSSEANQFETIKFDNITIKPLSWGDACGENTMIIGDRYSVSEEQAKAHQMTLEFEVQDLKYDPWLFGYVTNKPCDI